MGRFLFLALALQVSWWGTALAVDASGPDQPTAPTSRLVPDLRLSIGDMPGETTLRLPLSSENAPFYGPFSPYLSLGAKTSPTIPWSSTFSSGLRNDPEGPESDLKLGAGFALPLSDRAQFFGEYNFLRGRLDPGAGRGLLQRESDGTDFRAGFSIRLK